jgi:hypothetical protein
MFEHQISHQHKSGLQHHISQGNAWLSASNGGVNTAALSYAAFEFRFALERLAVHYWVTLLGRKLEEKDFRDVASFKRIERRIYELAGHQKEINGNFAFIRIVLVVMKIDVPFTTPNIGLLAKHWDDCSELCHIAWPLSCSVTSVQEAAFSSLSTVSDTLISLVQSAGWPVLEEPRFMVIRDAFVAGQISEDDVIREFTQTGLWASVEFPDGSEPQFVGVPITKIDPDSTS